MTASMRPSTSACSLHSTGFALQRLVVNTAAAACNGPSLTTSATSGDPDVLSPAVAAPARKPLAAVTLTAPPPRSSDQRSPGIRGRCWRTAELDPPPPYRGC